MKRGYRYPSLDLDRDGFRLDAPVIRKGNLIIKNGVVVGFVQQVEAAIEPNEKDPADRRVSAKFQKQKNRS